jgi:hypothetical protein
VHESGVYFALSQKDNFTILDSFDLCLDFVFSSSCKSLLNGLEQSVISVSCNMSSLDRTVSSDTILA